MESHDKKPRAGEPDYLGVLRSLVVNMHRFITSGVTDLGAQRKVLIDVSQELDLILANIKATHRHDEVPICTHSCSEHEQILNPGLWSTLPMELLHRVFVKLPVPNIYRLKSLSKEWQASVESSNSEFSLVLKECLPSIFARVTWGGHANFELNILDERNNRWYGSQINIARGPSNFRLRHTTVDHWVHLSGAADAGLACYIDKDEDGLNEIFVINPMTGVITQLPGLKSMSYLNISMMRIVVDRDTYHYKVIVVNHKPPVKAEVYDSQVGKWTKLKPSAGRIFGMAYHWIQHEDCWNADKSGPCVYDCRNRKFYSFLQDEEIWLAEEVISYTLLEDRLFVLYWDQEADAPFIAEYCLPENATSWVKAKTHDCFPKAFWQPLELLLDQTCRLQASSGSLFVFILKKEEGWSLEGTPPTKYEYGWTYDLSTCKWRALPRATWWSPIFLDSFMSNVMCELHWNIRP